MFFRDAQQYIGSWVPTSIKNSYNYISDKATSSYKAVTTFPYVATAERAYQWITGANNLRNFKEGFLQPIKHIPEALVSFKESDKIRKALSQTIYSAASMFLIPFAYYRFVRPMLLTYAEEDSNSIWTMDLAVTLYLSKNTPRFIVKDTINNASVATAITEILPQNTSHFTCACDPPKKRQGDFNTNIYYFMHSILLALLTNQRGIGMPIDWVFTPWFIGQAFLDYRLNMCDDHRYEKVASNNFFLMGLGASTQFATWSIAKASGVDSVFANMALRSVVMKFGMLTTALRKERLPGNEYPFDATRRLRRATMKELQNTTNEIYKNIKQKQLINKSKNISNEINPLNYQPSLAAQYLIYFFFGNDYLHLNTLVRTEEINLLIQLKRAEITTVLNAIQTAQDHKYLLAAVNHVTRHLPDYFLPLGISKDEIKFFKKIVYLKPVKKALPIVARLVNHALQDPSLLESNTPQIEEVVDTKEILGGGTGFISVVQTNEKIDRNPEIVMTIPEEKPNEQGLKKSTSAKILEAINTPLDNKSERDSQNFNALAKIDLNYFNSNPPTYDEAVNYRKANNTITTMSTFRRKNKPSMLKNTLNYLTHNIPYKR